MEDIFTSVEENIISSCLKYLKIYNYDYNPVTSKYYYIFRI